MTTIRLPEVQEKFIEKVAVIERKTKSDIVKAAISEYMKRYDQLQTPYRLARIALENLEAVRGSCPKNIKLFSRIG